MQHSATWWAEQTVKRRPVLKLLLWFEAQQCVWTVGGKKKFKKKVQHGRSETKTETKNTQTRPGRAQDVPFSAAQKITFKVNLRFSFTKKKKETSGMKEKGETRWWKPRNYQHRHNLDHLVFFSKNCSNLTLTN